MNVHTCAHTLLCTQPVHHIFVTHTAQTHTVHLHCYGNGFLCTTHTYTHVQYTCYARILMKNIKLAFAALSITKVGEYEAIKDAILIRYNINEEAYRNRFRTEKRKDGETNREFSVRLMDLLQKWTKGKTSVDEIQQVIGMEQFLNSLPLEKRLWLVERKPGSCIAAGELVDEFEQTRRSVAEGKLPGSEYPTSVKKAVQCAYCDKSGHVEEDCRRKKEDMGGRSSGPSMRVRCYR